MGLSDRDYAREPSSGFQIRAPETAVGLLIAVNVVIFLIDVLSNGKISTALALRSDLAEHPWNCWQLITSGFVHDPNRLWHLLGNMIGLWFFGGDVERLYGRAEFLRIYFVAIFVGSLCWVLSQNLLMQHAATYMLGASGAVTCIWVLFALNFPNRMILFMGFLPMPAWILGLYYVVRDLGGFIDSLKGVQLDSTAFEAHLGGVILALAYQRFGWNFGRWLPRSVTMTAPRLRSVVRPKLKLHQPSTEETDLETEVDRLLAKITAGGYDSLSADEKRLLERASARYQKRRT